MFSLPLLCWKATKQHGFSRNSYNTEKGHYKTDKTKKITNLVSKHCYSGKRKIFTFPRHDKLDRIAIRNTNKRHNSIMYVYTNNIIFHLSIIKHNGYEIP